MEKRNKVANSPEIEAKKYYLNIFLMEILPLHME